MSCSAQITTRTIAHQHLTGDIINFYPSVSSAVLTIVNGLDLSDPTLTLVIASNSACWNKGCDVFTSYNGVSATNINVNSVVQANSAQWAIDTGADITLLQSNSANWQSNYSTFNTNSANWITQDVAQNAFVNVSGDIMTGALSAPSLSTDNLFVGASTIYFMNNHEIVETLRSADVLNFKSDYTTTNTNSANWQNSYATVNSVSAQWSGLTLFTETSALSARPLFTLLAHNASYTNIDVALGTKGSGAILSQVPDGTTTGGNIRGEWATDFQRYRLIADEVASGMYSVICGGSANKNNGINSVIIGGDKNYILANNSTICGGLMHTITSSGIYSFIGGGSDNRITKTYSIIGGGAFNTIIQDVGVICGGIRNRIDASYSSIVGGQNNDTKGFTNVSLIGSGLSACQINTTFVNNLSAQTAIFDKNGNSNNWNSCYTAFNTNSANFVLTFATVQTNSALWAIDTSADLTLLQTTSADWQSNYSTFNLNSAEWITINNAQNYFVNVSGDTMTGGLSAPSISSNSIWVIRNSLGTTSTTAFAITNNSAAANNAQQISPSLVWEGQGWASGSSASQSVKFLADILPIQDTNAQGIWRVKASYNNAALIGGLEYSPDARGSATGYYGMLRVGATASNHNYGFNIGPDTSTIENRVNNICYWTWYGDGFMTLNRNMSLAWASVDGYSGGDAIRYSQDTHIKREAAAILAMGLHSSTPINQTFKSCNGSGTDITGSNLTVGAGIGTGTGKGGSLIFATASALGTTGSTAGTLVSAFNISPDFTVTFAPYTNISVGKTITPAGTTGDQTINRTAGSVNFAALASSLILTNSFVTSASVIQVTVGSNDASMYAATVSAGNGAFVIFAKPSAPTAETIIYFTVL